MYVWFCWLSLVYLIIVFCDLTASTFAPDVSKLIEPLRNNALKTASGVAYASFFYIILAMAFGILVRTKKLSFIVATCIFVPLVFVTVFLSQYLPVMSILNMDNPKCIFSLILLAYCFIASILPVWLLLQPRDYLSSYLLFVCIILSFIGIIVAGPMSQVGVHFPAWTGWFAKGQGGLFPILFITIACGAVSGFHSLVSGGTSSKQVEKPEDMRRVGYGAMIVEGVLAIISVCAIMIVTKGSCKGLTPNEIFANGFGNFVNAIGIPAMYGKAFALLAISTFLLTTLDTCTRLARYIFEEMFNKKSILLNFIYTFLILLIPVLMVFTKIQDPENASLTIPVWKAIWPVFGASQQLLAGLCLMVVYIIRKHQGKSTGFVVIPMIFMIVASIWGVIRIMLNYIHSTNYSIIVFSAVLLILAVYICADVLGFGRKYWIKK